MTLNNGLIAFANLGYQVYISYLRETVLVRLIERSITTSAPDESSVESFQQLVGETVFDDDTLLEPITTRAVEHKDAIAAVRAPVLANGKTGRESPIHVANVIRMSAVRARLNVDKPGHELGSGTGRELDSLTLNTESSSRPVSRPDRA